jgi:hypothetical protein
MKELYDELGQKVHFYVNISLRMEEKRKPKEKRKMKEK